MKKTTLIQDWLFPSYKKAMTLICYWLFIPLALLAEESIKSENQDSVRIDPSTFKLIMLVAGVFLTIRLCIMLADFLAKVILSSLRKLYKLVTLIITIVIIIGIYIDPVGIALLFRSIILFLIN